MADPGAIRRERLHRARLYLVLEAAAAHVAEPALEGGVDMVQLREKDAPDREIVTAGERLRETCHRHGALLIVNDRADLALACGADGVHVGQQDEPLESVRERVGPDLIVGISTHTPAQVGAALGSTADYLGVGPVYATATKPHVAAVGEELVRHAADVASKPFFAIGGIDAGNTRRVAAAGATRVAVVRAIRDARDPRAAARALAEALDPQPAHGVR